MTQAVAKIDTACSLASVITGVMVKMARARTGLRMRELAAAAKVGVATIIRIEAAGQDVPNVGARVLLRVRKALEDAGAEFDDRAGSVRIK